MRQVDLRRQLGVSFFSCGVVRCVNFYSEIKLGGGRRSGRIALRVLVHETLERRELLASDLRATLLDSRLGDQSSSALSPNSRAQQRLELALQKSEFATQADTLGHTSENVLDALAFAKLNFAPRAVDSFKRTSKDISKIQPKLLGGGLGASLAWNSSTANQDNKLGTVGLAAMDKQQIEKFALGSIIPQLAHSKSSSEASNRGVCLSDGTILSSLPMAEGEGGEQTEVPEFDFPTLELASLVGTPDDFVPSTQSTSSSIDLNGSFDANSLNDPDYDADDTNWVHTMDRNWTSSDQWSFTERLVLVFNLEETVEDSGDVADLIDPEAEPSDPNLDEAGDWSSTSDITRVGFFMMTFVASRGISTPSAAGVKWSIAVDYSDIVSISSTAAGDSAGTPSATNDPENDPEALPADFNSYATWGASVGIVIHSSGGFFVSSTPAIATGSVIERTIDANGYNDMGGNILFGSNWSSASLSGSLSPVGSTGCVTCTSGAPASPLPDGGDLGLSLGNAGNAIDNSDPDLGTPFNPLGDFEGFGHASASSGGNAAQAGGNVQGNWNLQGVLTNGQWSNVLGGAFAAMAADTGGDGQSKHTFVYRPAPTVEPLWNGEKTTTVSLGYGWDYSGDESETLTAEANSDFVASSSGELETDDSGGTSEIDGDANSGGYDFLNLGATIISAQAWDVENEPNSGGTTIFANGHINGNTTLTYNSSNHGMGIGEYESISSELTTQNATANSDLSGKGKELLKIQTSMDYDTENDETSYYGDHWYLETEGESSSLEKYVNTYEVSGNLTATLTSTFNASTGSFDSTFSLGGDTEVSVSGLDMYGDPWEKTPFELALESIYTSGSEGYPTPPEEDPNGGLPPDYEYPSNPGSHGWIGWFGGSAGDSVEQGMNFVAGVADAATPTSWITRKAVGLATGFDGADEESTACFAGEVTGTVISVVVPAGGATKLANSFDDAGKCANWLTKLYNGGCFVAGTKVSLSEMPRSQALEDQLWVANSLQLSAVDAEFPWLESEPQSAASTAVLPARTTALQIPIEEVPLGARVPTKNPKPWEYDDSFPEPDQATWAKLSLTIERTDGGIVDAELLRPRSWINANGIQAGQYLPLSIPELEVAGHAVVTAIEDCPIIAPGEGSVVTGRFVTRRVDVIARIEVIGADGQIDIIEGTTIHPIWSLDRNDWVPLGELKKGEQLLGSADSVVIQNYCTVHQSVPVYNIEVHGEHVYAVGALQVPAHNSCLPIVNPSFKPLPGLGTKALLPANTMREVAGPWPAVMKDGQVFVHYMHIAANQSANGGKIGAVSQNGWVWLNNLGIVNKVKW